MMFGFLIIGVIAFVLFREKGSFSSCSHTNQKDAMDILKERFARGEISAEEFAQRKAELLKS